MEETMRFKKFAAIILMSTMIGTMSLSGCGGVNKDAVAITMTSDDKDAIEVTMGYANFEMCIRDSHHCVQRCTDDRGCQPVWCCSDE